MMLSIIAHHFVVNSGITELYDFSHVTPNMILIQLFGMWGKTGINVFTLITGYFMIQKDVTWKKILRMYLEIKFYVFLFYILFALTGYEAFTVRQLAKTTLSVAVELGKQYYGGCVIVLYFLIPFLNIWARSLSKTQYQKLLALGLVYFTGISTFLTVNVFYLTGWLALCYLIGGYIRMHPMKWDNVRFGFAAMLLSISVSVLSIIAISRYGSKLGFTSYYYFVADCQKLLAVIMSVSIFIFWKNLPIPYIKGVNAIASTTLGVLYIHANSDTMRRFLWKDLFDNMGHYHSPLLLPYACGVVIIVYIVCVILDLLRMKLIEKPLFAFLDRFQWIHKKLGK